MDLTKILTVSGRPGLYKLVAQSPRGIVSESLIDGKKITLFSNERISTLEEISIFTVESDIRLKEVLKTIFEKLEGKPAISHKSPANELRAFMEQMVPDYDAERVYNSDIQKLVNWYNLLLEKNMIDLEPDEKVKEVENQDNIDEKPVVKKEEPKAEKKPKPQAKTSAAKASKSTASAAPKPTQRKTSPRAK